MTTEEAPNAAPDAPSENTGPLRRALFLDVPYILDSLWRKAEFKCYRLGSVNLAEPHELVLRPAWQCGAFVLFVIMCWFAVFGPTADALCALAGDAFATRVRGVVGSLMFVGAGLLFLWMLNNLTARLTLRGEELAAANRAAANVAQREPARWEKAAAQGQKVAAAAGKLMSRQAEEYFGNLVRLGQAVAVPEVQHRDKLALGLGTILLAIGAALIAAPLAVTAYALRFGETDPMSCAQMEQAGPVIAQFVVFGLLTLGGFFIWRGLGKKRAFATFLTSGILLAAGVAVLWLGFMPDLPSEARGGFYPHVYLLLIGSLMGVALVARLLAQLLFSPLKRRTTFRDALATQDLVHNSRDPPDVSNLRLWSALINGVTGHLLHFLLLPALVAFISPTTFMWPLTFTFAGVSVILLMYGSLSNRWEQMLVFIDRWFLVGSPLVLSVAVMVVAALRLAEVQYVATVLDATPIGVLFVFVVMMYAALWLFEYWANRWVGEELLESLADRKAARRGFVPCAFKPADRKPWAQVTGRYVALHSTGRFVAQGWVECEVKGVAKREQAFTTYSLVELFDVLGAHDPQGEDLAHDVHRRVRLYFTLLNILLVATAYGLFCWHQNWSVPLAVEPMVRATTIKPELVSDAVQIAQVRRTGDTLGTRLVAQSTEGRPSIVVAASGGGTRAAVYSAVALEGMAQIDRARDVVLLSGVSGGGVSAAVFASRFQTLRVADPRAESADHPGPWSDYVGSVSQPFIQDVLEGVGELRIAGSWSLGALLQESLERRAFAPGMTSVQTFEQLHDPALILNTAISGHPYGDSELLKGRVAAPRVNGSCTEQSRPYANLAGGRLIFTNLDNVSGFPERSAAVPDLWLPYRIVNDGSVKLAAASALTANFPPVFSNARVRLKTRMTGNCDGESYFVTDGGATENLGLVSALFALRGTLKQVAADVHLTDIHVLALEASAIDYDYQDDRGIGAATGGSKERINSGMTQTLLDEVATLAAAHGAELRVHYLPLPVAFRSRGGFGTHWMFARNIVVSNPLLAAAPESQAWSGKDRDHVDLDRQEVMVTLRALFDATDPICARAERFHPDLTDAPAYWTPAVERVTRWICGHDDSRKTPALLPDYQVEAWANVVRDLASAQHGAPFEPYSRQSEAP